eukprot:COSAG06_NODE_3006_length_5969_cov_2.756218_6_plen_92_part_00
MYGVSETQSRGRVMTAHREPGGRWDRPRRYEDSNRDRYFARIDEVVKGDLAMRKRIIRACLRRQLQASIDAPAGSRTVSISVSAGLVNAAI